MKVLITGANGCLGNDLTNLLLEEGHELILIDRNSSNKTSDKVKSYNIDICDKEKILLIEDEIDAIIHLAAKVHFIPKNENDKEDFYRVNVEGTKNLYELGMRKNVKKFVFISTISVYGNKVNGIINEDTKFNPLTDYAKSKLMAEELGLEYLKKGLNYSCVRLATIYGNLDRGNYKSLISQCLNSIVPVVGDGSNKKPILYVKDASRAICKVMNEESAIGKSYLVCEGNYSYNEILNIISEVFDIKVRKLKIPLLLMKFGKKFSYGKIKKIFKRLRTLSSSIEVDGRHILNDLYMDYKFNLHRGLNESKDYYSKK